MSFTLLLGLGLLFGIGFGFFVQRAGLCFAHGIAEIFLGRGRRILRLFLTIFAITSLGFLLSGYVSPDLGLKPVGQIRGSGLINVISGLLFGAGIALNGGCILGTLRQLGEGNLTYLVTAISFIPGMALVVYGIDPLLEAAYEGHGRLLPQVLAVPAPWITGALVLAAGVWLWKLRHRKRAGRHHEQRVSQAA